MSFYTKIKTELSNKSQIINALKEMKERGEIARFQINEKKEKIEVDRDGDIVNISKTKEGNFGVAGDVRVARSFANRLKQYYAYESIKSNLPLDFEISHESEEAGDILLILKG